MGFSAKALILSEGRTASTDYLIIPHLMRLDYDVTVHNGTTVTRADLQNYQIVVISRYISVQLLTILAQCRQNGLTIIYFMDDDLFDFHALSGLPFAYQWKIISKALVHKHQLEKLCSAFWLSSPYLVGKYRALNPILLSPAVTTNTKAKNLAPIRVCYHGTASHKNELAWLIPIIKAVQMQSAHIHFEIFGSGKTAQAVKQLPRVSVLHPMSWPNYLAYTSIQKMDIGLAPLLPSPFNSARCATKFFDYARMGAVGIYTNTSPYREFIREGIDGYLLANEPSDWVEKILQLAGDPELLHTLSTGVKQHLENSHL